MALNEFDEEQFEPEFGTGGEPTPEPEKKPSNRNFLLAIGILGVILILALVLLALVAPGILNQQRASQNEQAAQIYANNTATAMAATAIAMQGAATSTPLPASELGPTKTPLVVMATSTPAVASTSALSANEQATVQALQTEMAAQGGAAGLTQTAAATALPSSGFADEVGLPGMIGLAAVLVAVIFLSRKLRTSAH
jgi:cytoskeletal protein RodZ